MPCFDSAVSNVKTRQKEEQRQTTRAKHKQKLLQDVGENFVFINLFSFISQEIAFVFSTKGTNLGSAHQIQIPQPIPF